MRGIKTLVIKDGNLYLNDEKVENLKNYKIASYAGTKTAELTIVIDVKIDQTVTESMML